MIIARLSENFDKVKQTNLYNRALEIYRNKL